MLIVCPNCATCYQVGPASLGPAGRSVRCVRCRTVWFASNSAAGPEIAAAHRTEVAEVAATPSGPEVAVSQESTRSPAGQHESGGTGGFNEVKRTDDSDAQAPPSLSVIESPPLAPLTIEATEVTDAPEDIETVAARRALEEAKRSSRRWRRLSWFIGAVALALLDAGLIGWRADVVRWAPQTAPLYGALGLPVNVRGLIFADVMVETQSQEGTRVLLVQGTIANAAAETVEIPRLRFAVRDGDGHEIHAWTAVPSRNSLAPGETLAFQSQLASPPPETREVLVRFFSRADLQAVTE
jgi:predicted Zn finger-like uncharacterized protein